MKAAMLQWSPMLITTIFNHAPVLKEVLWKQGEGVCAGSRRDNIYAGMYRPKLDFY